MRPSQHAAARSDTEAGHDGDEDLARWTHNWEGAERASFAVVFARGVVLRSLPSTRNSRSRVLGTLRLGDVVEGELRGEWLLLHGGGAGLSAADLGEGRGRWLLLDVRMERHVPVPEVRKAFGTALEVRCPDAQGAGYFLEVRPDEGEELCLGCPGFTPTLVRDLPPGAGVRLRCSLRARDGAVAAASAWVAARTAEVEAFRPADDYEVDPLGQRRVGCATCSSCPAFSRERGSAQATEDLPELRCRRCGCNVVAHKVWDPEAAEQASSGEARQRCKVLIERAISLPKAHVLARWRALDCPARGEAAGDSWPTLSRTFKEVVAWSDLHADMGKNMEHLRQLAEQPDTVLILAGDVATSLETIESSLRLLQKTFGAVFYVPGNHELWVAKKEGLSSVHKFLAILELCERLGVHTRPAFIAPSCAICPLFSWYKDNLADGFTRDKANIPFDVQTQWPWDITGRGDTHDAQQPEIADFFLGLNARRLEVAPRDGSFVVTLSHFVPRQECYSGPRRLCGVMGCREIDGQLRRCGAGAHVFGHSHVSVDREVEGVRYVQHPLGYPNDNHRKTWPLRIWLGGAAVRQGGGAGEDGADDGADSVDARARTVVLGGELKWFVWNSIWLPFNTAYAAGIAGQPGHTVSHAQKVEKTKEDTRRVAEHTEVILASGVLAGAVLGQLRSQAAAAGKEAAACCLVGKAFKEVPALPAPADFDEQRWEHMVRGLQLAASAITEQSLDEYFLRKKDERWELSPENWPKAVHFRKGQRLQQAYEEHWHHHVAPNPDTLEVVTSDVPDAPLSATIRADLQRAIEACPDEPLERPPGRWSQGGGAVWDESKLAFDRDAERALRAEMEGKSLEELRGAAPPEERALEVHVARADDPDDWRVVVAILSTRTVADLKEQIALQAGASPDAASASCSALELRTADEAVLADDAPLSAVEHAVSGGVTVAGLVGAVVGATAVGAAGAEAGTAGAAGAG